MIQAISINDTTALVSADGRLHEVTPAMAHRIDAAMHDAGYQRRARRDFWRRVTTIRYGAQDAVAQQLFTQQLIAKFDPYARRIGGTFRGNKERSYAAAGVA